jgi:hypothetical protein
VKALHVAVCVAGTLALGFLVGGTPERDIHVTVTVEGGPPIPDTLLIATESSMPANVARGQGDVHAGRISLRRLSELCSEPLFLTGIRFRIEDLDGSPIDPSDAINRISAEMVVPARKAGGSARGGLSPPTSRTERKHASDDQHTAGDRAVGSSTTAFIDVGLKEPALIPESEDLGVDIFIDISPEPTVSGDIEQILDGHEGCPSPVAVLANEDWPVTVPWKTTIIPHTLAGSFTNYPNPFAAGREVTTFTFYLPRGADVGVRLYTGFGRLVKTLDAGSTRGGQRMHEDITWDGKDERDATVQNGTYFAVLDVRYKDGARGEAVRKVAVLR